MSQALDTVREHASDVAGQVKDVAKHRAESIRKRVARETERRRIRAASSVESVAAATHQMVDGLRENEQEVLASLVERAADAIDGSSRYLQEHDLPEIGRQAANAARRHPLLFVAGGLLAGVAATAALRVWSDDGASPVARARAAAERLERGEMSS